jgi:pimeloyl-ACP methyl ester carboxylesterase
VNPFFFGRSERPLFGLFTRGRESGGVATAERAVLLCYPIGSEYLRAHRAFRQVNTLLNRGGTHVLRFDYSCTGDSAGPGVEATVEEWLDDVDWAIDELLDTAGTDTIDVVGLRWGAAFGALAAREREEVRRIVLWDPVVSGGEYFDEVMPEGVPGGVVGIEGYPFSEALVEGLRGIDLRRQLAEGGAVPTDIVASADRRSYRELHEALLEAGRPSRLDVVPSPGNWAQVDPFGDALIPQDIIRILLDRLQNGDA